MFPDTYYIETLIAIIPNREEDKWLEKYEYLNDYIVPRSSQKINITTDIGSYCLHRFVAFKMMREDIIKEAKDTLK